MKFIQITALAAALSFGETAFSQTPPAETMRVRNAVGQITITQNGRTVTLNPGDQIPEITDPHASFTAVNGEITMTVNGKTITAGPGATFTVNVSPTGVVNVAATGSVPVAIKTEDGHNVVLAGGSVVNMTTTGDGEQVAITVTGGTALVSDSSGGESQTVGVGETVDVSAIPNPETPAQIVPDNPIVQPLPLPYQISRTNPS